MPGYRFVCPYCGYTTTSRKKIESHLALAHGLTKIPKFNPKRMNQRMLERGY